MIDKGMTIQVNKGTKIKLANIPIHENSKKWKLRIGMEIRVKINEIVTLFILVKLDRLNKESENKINTKLSK